MPTQVQTYMPVQLPMAPHWMGQRIDRPIQDISHHHRHHSSIDTLPPSHHRHHPSIETLPPIDLHRHGETPDVIPPGQSGPWAPEEDEILLHARARGIGWDRVKAEYFPNKTSNACRKRYERLIAKRKANDWDEQRIQRLALAYRDHRQALWKPLADQLGERWEHVEKACMDRGLKTLQNLASNHTRVQAHQRRISHSGSGGSGDRIPSSSSHHSHNPSGGDAYAFDDSSLGVHDDSGIAMGLGDNDHGSHHGSHGSRRSSGSVMPGWNQILSQH